MDDRLQAFLDRLCQNYPDVDDLAKNAFSSVFVRDVTTIDSSYLSSVMLALNRFAGHVRFFGNEKRAAVKGLKRQLEGQKSVTIASLDFTSKATDKTKQAKAYAANPKLAQLDEQIAEAEYDAILVEGMDMIIQEHSNIIKYELNRRQREGRQL